MKKLTIIALAMLAIAGCQQKHGDDQALGKINVEPVITKATEVNFEAGDKVGLTIVAENAAANYAENECMTYSGDVFTSDLEWYADTYTASDFYAYYPYNESGAPASYFQVEDQSQGMIS